jgi:deoxyadenosine/deoxycytidine kinase
MFEEPKIYALPIQFNFLIQRALLLIRALNTGHSVIIERSHHDDRLFVEDHKDRGNISDAEFEAYLAIASSLHRSIPEPTIFVMLDASPSTSFQRIGEAETSGTRPKEFPNDEVKKAFIDAWHVRYQSFFAKLRAAKDAGSFPATTFINFSEADSFEEMIATIIKSFRSTKIKMASDVD